MIVQCNPPKFEPVEIRISIQTEEEFNALKHLVSMNEQEAEHVLRLISCQGYEGTPEELFKIADTIYNEVFAPRV